MWFDPLADAKNQRDLVRPICGSCARRRIMCFGFVDDIDYAFRDQTESARVNSERARSGRAGTRPVSIRSGSFLSSQSGDERHALTVTGRGDTRLSLPMPVTRTLEDRVVDILSSNWIMHPCSHVINPGYLHFLPWSYYFASPHSALQPGIESLAFASMQGSSTTDLRFAEMACARYGTALSRLRDTASMETFEMDSTFLTAVLVIDMFELIYLHREEPLGAHSRVVEHVLKARGASQLSSSSGFSLWRVAHHRLQVRQTLLGLEPLPEQMEWVNQLDLSNPMLHIAWDLVHIQQLCHQARQLANHEFEIAPVFVEAGLALLELMKDLLGSIQQWKDQVASPWQATLIDSGSIESEWVSQQSLPIPFPQCMRVYYGLWVAYEWCYDDIGQLMLLEALVDLLHRIRESGHDNEAHNLAEQVAFREAQINDVSNRLMETVLALIAPSPSRHTATNFRHQKLGDFFCLSAC